MSVSGNHMIHVVQQYQSYKHTVTRNLMSRPEEIKGNMCVHQPELVCIVLVWEE